ncbi:MAG: phosphoglycerate kinase [Candidatus Puniceispirillaceae bacterium]|mgnify:FL=1
MALSILDNLGQLAGKTLLVRVDFNCPLADGKVADATRIDRVLPGLTQLAEAGAGLVLLSHLGRPKGQQMPQFSLQPVRDYLSAALGYTVPLLTGLDDAARPAAGQMVMLENLRFWAAEEANDEGFAAQLATLGDVYVNDAFSCAHRAHASTHALARHLPAFAGPVMAAELQALGAALDQPQRPVAAVVGGAKVSTKLAVLTHLIDKVDRLLLGGGMANTFLAAKGVDMGASLMEADLVDTAAEIIAAADKKGCQLFLPEDGLAATEFKAGAAHRQIPNSAILATEMMLDIGPNAISHYQQALAGVRTVLWNGPMGAFEIAPFDTATVALARAVAKATEAGELLSVAGGGDTVAALNHAGVTDKFSYVSLAGGAFLEYIEGKTLPGIAVLAK